MLPNANAYMIPSNYPSPLDTQLSIKQERDIIYGEEIHYLCVNSSDRDTVAYPKVNDYRIRFEDNFKNVSSIEIISGSVANQNLVQSNPYLIMKTGDHDHLTFSNKNVNKGFALLYLKPTSSGHVQPELGCLQRNVRIFKTPLASLNSLNIQLLTPDGNLFSFGENDADVSVAYQNSFVFKITTKEKSRTELNFRGVF